MLTKKILSTLDADWEPPQPKKLAKIVAKLARWPKDLAVLYDFSGGGTVGKAEKLTTPWPKPKSKKAKKGHAELYEGPRQTSEMPLSSASRRCNIRISGDLDDLHRFADGMRIARAGITFHCSSEIMPVEGSLEDERFHLMWIGQDDDGDRIAYVPAAMGWRGFGEGHVVLVPKGGDEVVLGWLQSKRGDREREPEKRAARPRRNAKR